MAKITQIMADLDKIENGVWVDYLEDIKLCIAGINNENYKKMRAKILKPYIRQTRTKNLSTDQILDIIKPAVANHLLIGWKNIEDEKGKTIEYSPDKALGFFENPAFSDLYNFVLGIAGENEVFRQEEVEESLGN